ncbi:hypothetical protein DL96DRAFT_1625531 [Flagelloscypha sp. PMI_526]|nr:hypothetical protein DL96DRAFT_1625531 [Flagelloscypha sp. PMI_526]
MPLRGKKKKRWWNSTRDASVTLLEVLRDSADALPPLKSAAGFLSSGHKIAERIGTIPQTMEYLQSRLTNIDERIQTLFPQAVELDEDLAKRLNSYTLRLVEIAQDLESLCTPKKLVAQFMHLRRTESRLSSVSSKLDQAELDFHVIYTLSSHRASNAMHNDIDSLSLAVTMLHQKEEKLLTAVSSTNKIVVFFQSGPARGTATFRSHT